MRFKMPCAAFRLKKYLGDTLWTSTMSDNIDSLPELWDSEIAAVKHSPADRIPEFRQRHEDSGKISAIMGTE
jgi:hypothetical protein